MKTTTITEAICFIVPNGLRSFGELKFMKSSHAKSLKNLGIENLTDDATLVEVRIEDGKGTNYTDHGWGEKLCTLFGISWDPKHPTFIERDAPMFLPLGLVQDMKEGDTQEFITPSGAILRLKFAQLEGVYARFGRFDEVRNILSEQFFKRQAS